MAFSYQQLGGNSATRAGLRRQLTELDTARLEALAALDRATDAVAEARATERRREAARADLRREVQGSRDQRLRGA